MYDTTGYVDNVRKLSTSLEELESLPKVPTSTGEAANVCKKAEQSLRGGILANSRVAQTAFILFSTFPDLRPVLAASG
jgi:hypothetical protein